MEKTLQPQSFHAVFKTLEGFINQRYHAMNRYPNAPYFKSNIEHLESVHHYVRQGLISTDPKFWAGMILSRGTVNLMRIVCSDPAKRESQLKKVTDCLDILRIKTGRESA